MTHLHVGEPPRLTLVLGGARSGKSRFAESLATQPGRPVLYVATMVVSDEEMRARVEEHRRGRPTAWKTLEVARDVAEAVQAARADDEVVLVEDLALLTSNALLDVGEDSPGEPALKTVEENLRREVDGLCALSGPTIVVSNEVGMGVVPAYPLGRVFRDLLGLANQQLAARADRVYYMVAGIPVVVKGG